MNFCVKLLSIFLVLVMLASTVVSCAFQPNSNPSTQGGTTTNNGITVLPPNNDDNKDDINNGNHVGGVVVGNVTAPYIGDVHVSAGVTPDENNQVPSEGVSLESATASATIPGGVQMEEGANELALTINGIKDSSANVELSDTDVSTSLDVHVSGVAANNLVPMEVKLLAAALKGLNSTSITLYHVENGETIEMTYVPNDEPFTAHNQFKYDPVTGDVTLYIASFSEIMMVSDSDNAWEGNFDYSWYDANAKELYIANADQLAAFGAIVGGMNGQAQDSFAGKTVKLIADINLGDKESENNPDIIFYPIGYNSSDGKYEKTGVAVTTGFYNFCGTFNGNGHTITNFYQNTWEMKGDNNYYDAALQYYRDGMGLFGKVYGGTVKNLTVKNFSSDGEYTTTGVIAAYADGATFENISIFNCNPRVYNIGNGGIVGCVGWYAKEAGLKTTFKNITVDNSNKISALWGSYDVACGGIVGQYYPTSGQTSANKPANGGVHFENCHVSAIMDVYNDVCANYQYYAYRYTGMLIGSVRENVTIDGHVYPDMTGITAKYCTVHFGDWNDYYYCELVANTTASYTHDHQMSRLTQVASVDVENMTITTLDGETVAIPTSGRVNYVVVKAKGDDGKWIHGDGHDYAECYHFVDGTVWNHEDAGYHNGENGEKFIDENGDGEADLKEDKQLIYREFNQLFTGYGWGVTSKGLEDYNGVNNQDIIILEGEVEGSVSKFQSTGNIEFETGTNATIGDIFQYIQDCGVEIKNDQVNVTVSPVTGSTAKATVQTADNWEDFYLELSGIGALNVTISDYYFCKSTTVTINVTPTHKFENKFTGNFLYRLGNQNTVTLGSIFKQMEGKPSILGDKITVTVNNCTFTPNTTDWTKGTLNFSGYTGIATIKIKDSESLEREIKVEIVDAKNITSIENTNTNNTVLLNDTTASSLNISNGYAFYGNGFKVTFGGDGSYRSAAISYGFVTIDNGGIMDNVQIICNIFPESYLFTNEMKAGSDGRYPYGYSAVIITGNSTISNSYIYGARNNIQIGEGNVTIENTVLECGSLSNIHIRTSNSAYTVTLKNLTTIQYQTTSTYDTSKKVMGFGILVGTNESDSNPTINLVGTLKQYNWVNSSHGSNLSNTYAKSAINAALQVKAYQHEIDNQTMVNMGIAFFNSKTATITDNRDNKTDVPYKLNSINISGYEGQVYSVSNSELAKSYYYANADAVEKYVPKTNREITPNVVFNGISSDAIEFGTVFENGSWITKLSADLDNIDGGTYSFKFNDLAIGKNGVALSFIVIDSNGNAVDKNATITLNQLMTNNYTLVVTDNQIYGTDGNLTGESITHNLPFVLNATKTSIEPPKFTNNGTATGIKLVDKKGGDWRPAYTVLTGVTVTYWSASNGKETTIDLSTLYNKGTISANVWTYTCDDFTLTITGGQVHSDGTKITPIVSNGTLYFASTNKAFGTGTTSRDIILDYVFTDKNDSTTWNRKESVAHANMTEYDYSKFKSGTLEEASSGSSCVTPETLITLADGSQVRVDSLTGNEMLLVWNMETGKLDVAPIMFLDSDPTAEYEVIRLYFSDGTSVNVISEHGFWDYDLNRYVYLDRNAADYIGHTFAKQNGDKLEKVQLVDVVIETEVTTAWSPVTVGHLCYFVNGMLSMPGGVGGLFNIFEVDPETMTYDYEQIEKDIATYGLFTYEELNAICPLTEEMFNAAGGAYLKISIGKGNLTMDELIAMITRYSKYI